MKTPIEGDFVLAEDYAVAASADNTILAYSSDIERFEEWGGTIPSTSEQICAYLAEHAQTHKAATLSRWIASISVAHQQRGYDTPTRGIDVKHTLRGIRRTHIYKKHRVSPITLDILTAIVDKLPVDTLTGIRDRAIFLVGFSAAMRRSEVCNLKVEDLCHDTRGMVLNLGKSKTDQEADHSEVAIPKAKNPKYCPILALKAWLAGSDITEGAIFRSITRHGKIGKDPLTTQAIANIVKRGVASIGLDKSTYSGHSLRAGLVTSAVEAGKPNHKIREITRHRTDSMLDTYIRDAEQFRDNAADLL